MCGIAGYRNFNSYKIKKEVLENMVESLSHRGPDSRGLYYDNYIALGHCRLSIIDLSESGNQPMCNEDRTIWVSFNGEIYNYPDLRRELIGRGHIFRSQCDTEVILHAYEQWGNLCLERFNGMFAFAVWDSRRKLLWLARDRIGIKPLFYVYKQNFFGFASEIKALLHLPVDNTSIDKQSLAYYLALNWVPTPRTMLKDIRQLNPGWHMTIDSQGSIHQEKYWELQYENAPQESDKHYFERFEEILTDSVRHRLRADVPSGAFLSGGLDSSSIVSLMARLSKQPVKTFSFRFRENTYDETPYSKLVSNKLGTKHFEIEVDDRPEEVIEEVVRHAEEPTADSSMIPLYYLARETRKHVKMVLSGDGADEILAGYETYQAYYLARFFQAIPLPLRKKLIQPLIDKLPVSYKKVSLESKLKRFIHAADVANESIHAVWRIICNLEQRKNLLAPVWNEPDVRRDITELYRHYFKECPASKKLDRLLWIDTRLYLPSDMLVKVDRMTMAHGLEARVPFLDHNLVEFCAGLPPKYKLRWGYSKKYILKTTMSSQLPHKIIGRRKQGFNVPISLWINGSLRNFVLDYLSPSMVKKTGMFNDKAVTRMIDDHFHGIADYSHQIWSLLTFMLWHKAVTDYS